MFSPYDLAHLHHIARHYVAAGLATRLANRQRRALRWQHMRGALGWLVPDPASPEGQAAHG